ncbi:MAG: hypothetical protein A3C84_03705 [Candidatus Ryanbacteria bacterium RIFCSPHIGHO2_02_FULL_48_12]|uniref:Uncharacterized protein n=1 Tax=Candidatus Ryanbacteria bacterium RIFCSPHIGHO2_01_FULL_48_27 TaxID=1802115 RepID=A0A1G2G6I5_9BACT|nr:MAG: hypothetical protein A2756_03075 [Candidatus Ryanbacteria bacterium RIFCSPHIGHO2_01_FULL_48_27]OGZ49446.1 MAG: hypothetical protein A3C84_03705 [Candidatus Ryanbacteria bacterium RIFCSPHIGHO2_02_FULL_48_12]
MDCGKNEKTYRLSYLDVASELSDAIVATAAQKYLQGQVRIIRWVIEHNETRQAFDISGKCFPIHVQHLLIHYENC